MTQPFPTQHTHELLEREAKTEGDRVNTEYYLQFADHYFRVLADNRSRQEEQQGWRRNRDDNRFDGDGEGEDEAESDTEMVQGVGDRFRTQDAGEEGDRPQRQNQREPRRARRNHEETEAAEQAQVPEEIAEQSQAHDTDEAAHKPKRAPRARRASKSDAVADESHTMDAAILPPSISRADNDSGDRTSTRLNFS